MGGMFGGGSDTTTIEMPAWLEDATRRALQRGDEVAQTGYVPYMGIDVAGRSPGMDAARQNTNMAAQAFGLEGTGPSYLPEQQTMGGLSGYRSFRPYNAARMELRDRFPGQFNHLQDMFIDPRTGEGPQSMNFAQGLLQGPMPMPVGDQTLGGEGREDRAFEDQMRQDRDDREAELGRSFDVQGYSSPLDMIDGGGPGASGGAFEGGGIVSDLANAATGRERRSPVRGRRR